MKTYAVIGLGKFGSCVVSDLMKHDINVIAIDRSNDAIKEFKMQCENVLMIDATDIEALKECGIGDVDVAVVSIGTDIEGSILSVMALQEAGVKMIIAKACNKIHGKILSKIGVSRVVYPERDAAKRLVDDFLQNPEFEIFDLTNSVKVARILTNDNLIGKEINKIFKKNIRTIAYKKNEHWDFDFDGTSQLQEKESLLILGYGESINEFIKKYYL